MTITISGHTVPVDDMQHAERLLDHAAILEHDALEQWLYAGCPECQHEDFSEEVQS